MLFRSWTQKPRNKSLSNLLVERTQLMMKMDIMRGGEGGGVVPFLGAQEQEYYQRGGGDKIHSYTSQSGTL